MMKTFIKHSLSGMACAAVMGLAAAPADAILVTRNISGIWDLPDQERHGMTITVTQLASGEKTVVAYLATYDQAGNPTWFAAQADVTGDTISGPLYRVTGPGFLDPRGTPSNFEQVGDLQIQFPDCNNGLVSFQTPSDVIGTGGFRIQRISSLFRETCTGGVVDDTPSGTTVSQFEVFFTNTGLDADASGKAKYEERADRTEFSVEAEDLDVGVYELFIDGIKRADIEVQTRTNGTQGEVEFRSPVEPGKLLLNFDPRGALLEVSQGSDVYLTSDLPMQGTPPPPGGTGGTPPPFGNVEIEIDLVNQGVIGAANGDAELEQRSDRVDFKVEIEDVPVGSYDLRVDGTLRASIEVVNTPSGPEGEVEFRFPVEPGKLLLDFDPRGTLVAVQDTGVTILSVDFPAMGSGGDDGDSGSGDDNGSDDDDGGDDNSGSDDDDNDDGSGGGTTGLDITVPFTNQGADGDASGRAEYEQRSDRIDFSVEVEDLDDGIYELQVGGSGVAMITVSGGEGEVEFRDPAEPGKLPLTFDPLGQTVSVMQGGTTYLSLTMPTP